MTEGTIRLEQRFPALGCRRCSGYLGRDVVLCKAGGPAYRVGSFQTYYENATRYLTFALSPVVVFVAIFADAIGTEHSRRPLILWS